MSTPLRSITDFFPRRTQLASPGCFYFDPGEVLGVTASQDESSVDVHLPSGIVRLVFHRNTDGGPPYIYEIVRNIKNARNARESPRVRGSAPSSSKGRALDLTVGKEGG